MRSHHDPRRRAPCRRLDRDRLPGHARLQSVRPDTRDRVLAAADELEYTPSQLGRQLAERRHAANGIVFPDLSGPYYAEVVLGYEAVAAELRRSVLILSTHGRTTPRPPSARWPARCDGLVILGRTVSDEVVEQLAARGIPLVLVARPPIGDGRLGQRREPRQRRRARRAPARAGRPPHRLRRRPRRSPDVAERWRGVRRRPLRDGGADAPRPGHRGRLRRGPAGAASPPRRSQRPACPTRSSAPTTSSRSA